MGLNIEDLTRTIRTKTTECGCGCWVFSGATNSKGYATAKIKGKQVAVHRYVFEKYVHPLINDDTVDHLCERHRNCINPAHMEAVSRSENSRRANSRRWHDEIDYSACTINQPEQPTKETS